MELKTVLDWWNYNKLSLNPAKSEYLLITHREVTADPQLFIGSDAITRKQYVRYLGLYIDQKLKFQHQIDHVKKKLQQFSGISFRIKNYLNLDAAKNLYYGCIYSVIKYCIVAWGGVLHCTQRAASLVRLQDKIISNLFSRFCCRDSNLYKSMNMLKITDIHRFYCALYMFRLIKSNSCPTLNDCVNISYPSHEHDTRGRNRLVLPFPRVEATRINYEYQLTNIWNEVPEVIKNEDSAKKFKRLLKDFYISHY